VTFPLPCRCRLPPFLRGASIAAGAFIAAAPARADQCRVEMTGTPSPAWQGAADSLESSKLTDADCTSVLVEVSEHGARLTFVTPDGRSAERELTDPDELQATVDALRVRGPSAKQAASVPKATGTTPKDARPGEPPRSTQGTSVIFALGAGVRAGTKLASPVLNGAVSLLVRRWEFGLNAASEMQYGAFAENEGAPMDRGSAFSLGLSAGRREPAGGVALLAGARTAFGWLVFNQNGPAEQPTDARETEWRLGAYLGIAVPRRSSIRFRADLGADLVVANRPPDSYAMTPAWGMTALVGAEIGGS
jgi:hypothetical protein